MKHLLYTEQSKYKRLITFNLILVAGSVESTEILPLFEHFRFCLYLNVEVLSDCSRRGVECKMPNIFKCLEADVLGGRLGSEK